MNGDIPSVPIITLAGVSSLTNGNLLLLNLIHITIFLFKNVPSVL